jgi:DNA repair protein RadA/Sms
MEGIRPMMVEVQALVSSAVYGTPQRSTTGFDLNRLHMLLAVLEKRAGFFFNQQDVFLNIAGGFKISDPSLDLSVVAALVSSFEDQAISRDFAFAGEVGLSGEVRPIARAEIRILEAHRMGFSHMFLPQNNLKKLHMKDKDIQLIGVSKIDELMHHLFD